MRPPPSTTQRIQSRGRSLRTIGGREVIASAALYAATFVSQPPVRGGVLDAPCLRDCRAALDAPVGPDGWHPCLPRRARLRPPPNASNSAGTARAPFQTGEPALSFIPGREGVEALPYGVWGMFPHCNYVVRHPTEGASGTPHPTVVCILYAAACNVGTPPAHHCARRGQIKPRDCLNPGVWRKLPLGFGQSRLVYAASMVL